MKEEPDYFRVFKNALSGKKTKKIVGKFKDKTGKTHIMEFSTRIIKENNKVKYIFVIGRDVTDAETLKSMSEELKATQEELRTLKEDFEQKVSERTAEIEKLLKHKDEFIAQLGHDLKSPLTPLVGLLPIVKEQVEDPKLKRLLDVSIRNVKYMKDLVVKTLELERLNSSKTVFNISDINLLETVNSIIENKQLIFKEKKINIENNINKKIMVRTNNLQLGELFDNLITNAVKFTPQDGTITIDAKKVKDFVTVSIKDTGIGMTKEQINSIFAEFYKVDSARHDLDSSGLGLSICKRIIEKHGGQIWAESPGLGKGTTFYFTIPFRLEKIKASSE